MLNLENLGYSDATMHLPPRREDSAEYMKGYHKGLKDNNPSKEV